MDREESIALSYARTQYALPLARPTAGGLSFHPVVNLLNVRYLLFRQQPPRELSVILSGDGYWIAENRSALPRVSVPRTVHVVNDDKQAASKMKDFDFDPRDSAFVTDRLQLPDTMRGQTSVRYETPTRAVIDVDMQTAGLVLLADLWDAGWRAQLDGAACPTYRVDLALRGYQVPAGKHRILCIYDPQSLHTGLYAAAVGGTVLLLWVIWKGRGILRNQRATNADSGL
jgi:hypothetical protein